MAVDFESRLKEILQRDPRFTRDAYCFTFEALEHTCRGLERRGHVSGRELLEGIRELAIEQFGGLARMVLAQWGVLSTEHFGEIVFSLVEAGLMGKTETDTREDFKNVFSFDEAFPILAAAKRRKR